MIYKIQGTIHFRSDDGLIWLDEDSCVTLTATTSRLLKFLLDHREHVVYRNEILEKVWDAHGLRTSSHSLNKYISDLSHLQEYGLCRGDYRYRAPGWVYGVREHTD